MNNEIIIRGESVLKRDGDCHVAFSSNDPSEQLTQWYYWLIGARA